MARQTQTERLFDDMSAFNRRLRSLFAIRARETGLTLTRARVLFALGRRGSLSQKDLAQELEVETPTLVRVLDGMEAQNLIERRQEDGDRRVKQIHVTKEGTATSGKVQALAAELRQQLVEGVAEEDLAVALRVFQQLNGNFFRLTAGIQEDE